MGCRRSEAVNRQQQLLLFLGDPACLLALLTRAHSSFDNQRDAPALAAVAVTSNEWSEVVDGVAAVCAVQLDAQCRASSAPLRDLLDAPTALAACCGFDLCH